MTTPERVAATLTLVTILWWFAPILRDHGILAGALWLLASVGYLAGILWMSGAHKRGGT